MTGRLALLGVLLATMPLAVDLPASRDSAGIGESRIQIAGGTGQLAIVSRGCNGEVLRVVHQQLHAGALVVEHQFPQDIVLGIRAGNVQTRSSGYSGVYTGPLVPPFMDSLVTVHADNVYVNPFIAFEGRSAGAGLGYLSADRPFRVGEGAYQRMTATGHLRLGTAESQLNLRWMEDVPLESEGHFSADFGVRTNPWLETGIFVGLAGPYDGAMLGLRGRVWFTRDAALQVKAAVAGNGQYSVHGSFNGRYRWRR